MQYYRVGMCTKKVYDDESAEKTVECYRIICANSEEELQALIEEKHDPYDCINCGNRCSIGKEKLDAEFLIPEEI